MRNGFGDCDDDNGRVVDLDFRREEDTKRRPKSGFRRHGDGDDDDSRSSLLGVAGDEKSEVVVEDTMVDGNNLVRGSMM